MPSAKAEPAAIQAGADRFERGEAFDYFLSERATDALVGAAGVRLPTPVTAEIGYWVRSDRHRRGHATEATRVLTSAVHLGGSSVLHLCKEIGVPVVSDFEDFAERERMDR